MVKRKIILGISLFGAVILLLGGRDLFMREHQWDYLVEGHKQETEKLEALVNVEVFQENRQVMDTIADRIKQIEEQTEVVAMVRTDGKVLLRCDTKMYEEEAIKEVDVLLYEALDEAREVCASIFEVDWSFRKENIADRDCEVWLTSRDLDYCTGRSTMILYRRIKEGENMGEKHLDGNWYLTVSFLVMDGI